MTTIFLSFFFFCLFVTVQDIYSIPLFLMLQNESRRFRMKFSPLEKCSAEFQCRNCVQELAKYFPLKLTTSGSQSQQVILMCLMNVLDVINDSYYDFLCCRSCGVWISIRNTQILHCVK